MAQHPRSFQTSGEWKTSRSSAQPMSQKTAFPTAGRTQNPTAFGAGTRPQSGTMHPQHRQQQNQQPRSAQGQWRQGTQQTQAAPAKRHNDNVISSPLRGYLSHRSMSQLVDEISQLKRYQILFRTIAEESLWECLIEEKDWVLVRSGNFTPSELHTTPLFADMKAKFIDDKNSLVCFALWYKRNMFLSRSDDDTLHTVRILFELIEDSNLSSTNSYKENILQCCIAAHLDKAMPRFTAPGTFDRVYNMLTLSTASLSGTTAAILRRTNEQIPAFAPFLAWISTAHGGVEILASQVVARFSAKGGTLDKCIEPIIGSLSQSVNVTAIPFAKFYTSTAFAGNEQTIARFRQALATELTRQGITVDEEAVDEAKAKKLAIQVANKITDKNSEKFADSIAEVLNLSNGVYILAEPFVKNRIETGARLRNNDLIAALIKSYKQSMDKAQAREFSLAVHSIAESYDLKELAEQGEKQNTCGVIYGLTGIVSPDWIARWGTTAREAVMCAILAGEKKTDYVPPQHYIDFARTVTSGPQRFNAETYLAKYTKKASASSGAGVAAAVSSADSTPVKKVKKSKSKKSLDLDELVSSKFQELNTLTFKKIEDEVSFFQALGESVPDSLHHDLSVAILKNIVLLTEDSIEKLLLNFEHIGIDSEVFQAVLADAQSIKESIELDDEQSETFDRYISSFSG